MGKVGWSVVNIAIVGFFAGRRGEEFKVFTIPDKKRAVLPGDGS